MRMGEINQLAEETGSQIIPADATNVEELDHLVNQSMEILGGKIDFVLHSIGMSPNVRKRNITLKTTIVFIVRLWTFQPLHFTKR